MYFLGILLLLVSEVLQGMSKFSVQVDDVERKSLIGTQSDGCTQYGTASLSKCLLIFSPSCFELFFIFYFLDSVGSDDDAIARSSVAGEDGCCWVCLGNDDPSDLFYPCNCRLHRKCIKQWVAKVRGQRTSE